MRYYVVDFNSQKEEFEVVEAFDSQVSADELSGKLKAEGRRSAGVVGWTDREYKAFQQTADEDFVERILASMSDQRFSKLMQNGAIRNRFVAGANSP